MTEIPTNKFRIFWAGKHPKPKKVFHAGFFAKRQQAINWCRKNQYLHKGLTILGPDGVEEPYENTNKVS